MAYLDREAVVLVVAADAADHALVGGGRRPGLARRVPVVRVVHGRSLLLA